MTKTTLIAGQVITLYKTSHGWASSPELAQAITDRHEAMMMDLRAGFQRDQYLQSKEMKGNNKREYKLGVDPDYYGNYIFNSLEEKS